MVFLIWKHYLFNILILKVLKNIKKFLLSYPSIKISNLNFHAQLEINVILSIIKIGINVYLLTNNNY